MKSTKSLKRKTIGDYLIPTILIIWGLIVLFPFFSVIVISFTSESEYIKTPLLFFPKEPTLASYRQIFEDGRIASGYFTTFKLLAMSLPLSLFLTTSFAYGMSRKNFPGRKFIFYFVLIAMIFDGGIIPLYMLMKDIHLVPNNLWAVVLANTVSTFYMILMHNFFKALPDSLMESARIDGAGEWRILTRIVLPLSAPVIATITLFYTVDRWNEWFNPMIFLQKGYLHPLQLVLRSIVIDAQIDTLKTGDTIELASNFAMGVKTAAIICTMLPVMLFFPFLQKHFVKGIMVGAVK
ncbi:putative aldouronate transport system permease protein [Paenibacillus sp. UNC496MF]|uniref:carbohydrate ABC transporter permease n=1 Tax=Paenibacillus sp. UNC496MF TaxID=1502753 RepID=UPI0008EA5139|nr:carbohydrate ABC transporter permease [Paenibacillus sp. UNC496MF]SFJ54936.1 putative aldouronate transport system permease protein [Paenibacillus sp. UNC496MF]